MRRNARKLAIVGVVAVASAVLVACGGDTDESTDVLVINAAATKANPATLTLGEFGAFHVWYDTTTAPRYAAGELVNTRLMRPVVRWDLKAGDDLESVAGTPLTLRAEVELLQDGVPVDAYFSVDGGGMTKNEIVESMTWLRDSVIIDGFVILPYETPPRSEGTDWLASNTGADFEFRFSDIEVGSTPFTPTEIFQTPPPPAPTFGASPEDQFNKLVHDKGWSLPQAYDSYRDSAGKPVSEERVPALAVQSLFRQVNERATSTTGPFSPTMALENWMQSWNPELLAAGVDMLGDDQIKETWRRVQVGDIEHWFGNGTWVVGTGEGQIPPGTYRTTAAPDDLIEDGYWERTSPSGDIIANDFVSSAQEATVTIAQTDGQFETSRMGTWKPVG